MSRRKIECLHFDWKFYHAPLSTLDRKTLFDMRESVAQEMEIIDEKYPDAYRFLSDSPASDDIWKQYRGYGDDRYLYSYLYGMESELSQLMAIV